MSVDEEPLRDTSMPDQAVAHEADSTQPGLGSAEAGVHHICESAHPLVLCIFCRAQDSGDPRAALTLEHRQRNGPIACVIHHTSVVDSNYLAGSPQSELDDSKFTV